MKNRVSEKSDDNITSNAPSEVEKCMSEALLNDEEKAAVNNAIDIQTLKKDTILLREGEIATKCYSVLKGCVRQYYLKDGEEKTTFFYTEGDTIVSFASASKKIPANHYISCVEDTTVSIIPMDKEAELYKRYPRFESLSRADAELQLGDYQDLLATYITTTPEERYLKLLNTRPDLLNRVPQYQLASYLGIKPESLSRIRKRIMAK